MKTPTLTGKQVADFRARLEINQTEFAIMIGLTGTCCRSVVSKMESGQRKIRGPVAKLITLLVAAEKNGSIKFTDIVNNL